MSEVSVPEEAMEAVSATCANCRKVSEFSKPADHTYDLKWECPFCEAVNVLAGTTPHPVAVPTTVEVVAAGED